MACGWAPGRRLGPNSIGTKWCVAVVDQLIRRFLLGAEAERMVKVQRLPYKHGLANQIEFPMAIDRRLDARTPWSRPGI